MKPTLTAADLFRLVPELLLQDRMDYYRCIKSGGRGVVEGVPVFVEEDYIFTAKDVVRSLYRSWLKLETKKGDNNVCENVSIGSESVPLVSEKILAQKDKQDPE
jgi:hypothetical protein